MERRSGKYWSPGLLKDRGWTRALMDELLPKPQWRRNNGRSVPLWHREDVQRAESTPAFREKSIGKKPTQKDVTAAQSAVERTAAALSAAWDRAERGEDLPWVLAGRYHQTILDHLPAAAGDRVLRAGQVSGYLSRFLSLTRRCDSGELPGDLSRFLQAGPWMGDNLTSPLALQVVEHYPAVLHAAAVRTVVMDDLVVRLRDFRL